MKTVILLVVCIAVAAAGPFNFNLGDGTVGGSFKAGGIDIGGHVDYKGKIGGGLTAEAEGQGISVGGDRLNGGGWNGHIGGQLGPVGGHASLGQGANGHWNGGAGVDIGASFGMEYIAEGEEGYEGEEAFECEEAGEYYIEDGLQFGHGSIGGSFKAFGADVGAHVDYGNKVGGGFNAKWEG